MQQPSQSHSWDAGTMLLRRACGRWECNSAAEKLVVAQVRMLEENTTSKMEKVPTVKPSWDEITTQKSWRKIPHQTSS